MDCSSLPIAIYELLKTATETAFEAEHNFYLFQLLETRADNDTWTPFPSRYLIRTAVT